MGNILYFQHSLARVFGGGHRPVHGNLLYHLFLTLAF